MAVNDTIPKSRITLTYRTDVKGEKEDVNLPFRLLVMGDLSGGTSTDRAKDLDQRDLRNLDGKNTDSVMRDMAMSLELNVPNKIDPENGDTIDVKLPVVSMRSFDPAEVANHVPKIAALTLLKKLLLEVQGNLDNRKEFRRTMRALAQNPEAVEKLRGELAGFDSFKLPAPSEGGEGSETSTEEDSEG